MKRWRKCVYKPAWAAAAQHRRRRTSLWAHIVRGWRHLDASRTRHGDGRLELADALYDDCL